VESTLAFKPGSVARFVVELTPKRA
jgi:hypothetical protein